MLWRLTLSRSVRQLALASLRAGTTPAADKAEVVLVAVQATSLVMVVAGEANTPQVAAAAVSLAERREQEEG